MAGNARDVVVDIIANDKTKAGVDAAARAFEGLDRKVKRSSQDRNKLLQRDTIQSRSMFKALFGGLVDAGQKSGMLAADATITSFGAAFKALPPEVKLGIVGGMVGAATIAAPVVVATMNAAILTGLGAGGLAAGIMIAVQDPAVAAAYTNLGSKIGKQLKEDVKPFRAELIDASLVFGEGFDRVEPRIKRIFGNLSTVIMPLAEDATKAFENLAPGLEKAFAASLPLLREFARWLPQLGAAVGHLFGTIADAGPGAAMTFQVILITIEATIRIIDGLIAVMGGAMNGVAALTQGAVSLYRAISGDEPANLTRQLTTLATSANSAAFTFNGLTHAEYNTAAAANQVNAAFDALFGAMMSVDQANLAVKAGMAQLTETIKGNAKTLNQNTDAGRENVGAILGQVQALERKRQADIAAGNGTVEATNRANAAYAANVAALRRVLIQMGFTVAEVDVLIAKYQQIPRNIGTTITTTYKVVGSPSGPVELGRGQGREKFGGLEGWRPGEFAGGRGGGRGGGDFAMVGAGAGRTTPPYKIDSHVDVSVLLDGEPVRRAATRAAQREVKRQVWRDKVGPR